MSTTNRYWSRSARTADNKSNGSPNTELVQVKRPLSLNPWSVGGETRSGTVWISMKPKKIIDQYSKGGGTFDTIETNKEFLFMAPQNIAENIVHHWEAYESVASRMAQKARSAIKLASETAAIYNVGKKFLEPENIKKTYRGAKNINEGTTIEQLATKAYGAIQGSKVPKIKVDTPLYYTNSDRRQLVFEFQLFNESVPNTNPQDILLKPIQELMKYSSPELVNEGNINIEFPYMFEVKTVPYAFLNYKTCALIAVQPTWNAPYVNGLPSSCNLQLTFQDLSPLYAATIKKGSIINVKSGSIDEATKRDREAQKKYAEKPIKPKVKFLGSGKVAGL